MAVAGYLVVTAGALLTSLPMILLGSLFLGAGNTAVMLGRYAAADFGPETSRGALEGLGAGGDDDRCGGGPNLLAPASGLAAGLGLPGLAGPYRVAAIGFIAAAGTLAVGLHATPVRSLGDGTERESTATGGTAVAAGTAGLSRQGRAGPACSAWPIC